MRRALPVLVGVVLVVGGLFLLLTIFSDRDSADIATAPQGPGTLETDPGDPPTSGPTGGPNVTSEELVDDATLVQALALGNVALVYGTPKPPPELVALRDRVTGPFDPELAAAGQMALLVRRPAVDGIQALAWQRRLQVDAPTDPALEAFVNAWLGAVAPDVG